MSNPTDAEVQEAMERIEAPVISRKHCHDGVWFVEVRESDLRALLRAAFPGVGKEG